MTVKQYRMVRAALLVIAALVAGVMIVGGMVLIAEAGLAIATFIAEIILGAALGTAAWKMIMGLGQRIQWGAPNPLSVFDGDGWQEHAEAHYNAN